MKKCTLILAALFFVRFGFGQANLAVQAPLNTSTSSLSLPNGAASYSFMTGCFLVLQSELTNIPSGTNITSFGFTLNTGASSAVPGNFTVALENTSDITYQKGTVIATALSGMTQVFASVLTVPLAGTTTSMMVTLSTPFNYTGGGLYVFCDWASTGPFAATGAIGQTETVALPLPGGGGAQAGGSSAASSLFITATRPSFLFGFANPNTNDLDVAEIEAPGKVAVPLYSPEVIKAYIVNLSNTTVTNKSVFLNVSGANIFSNTQVISSLAPGAGTLMSFPGFTPQLLGINTISVSVGSDQNNQNNSAVATQSGTCNEWGQSPTVWTYTGTAGVGFNAGAGIGASGVIATPLVNATSSSLAGLNLAIANNAASVAMQIYGVLLSSAGNVVATTNTITLTTAMLGTFQTFTFSSSQALTAGNNYYIGMAEWNTTQVLCYPFGTFPTSYYPANLFYYGGLGGGVTVLTPNYGWFGFNAIYDSQANLPISSTPTSVCTGACATLSVQGLTTSIWNTGTTGSTTTACPVTGQNSYTVTGTSTLGCSASAVISVPINPLPNLSIVSATNAVCVGGSLSFTATGASTYSWNAGNSTGTADNSASPLMDTSYIVTGTDVNSCVNQDTVSFSVISLNVSVSSNTAVCKGKSAALTASSTDSTYSYDWLIGNNGLPFPTAVVTPTATTTYSLNVADLNGCTQTNTVMVTVYPPPSLTITSSKAILCKGESAVLTPSGAVNYTWTANTGNGPLTVSPKQNTPYTLTGVDNNGCTATISITQSVSACTGIELQAAGVANIQIFPNPSKGLITIHCGNVPQNGFVELYNPLGALVKRQTLNAEDTSLDLSEQPAGIYLVYLIGENEVKQVTKLVKQ